MTDVARFLDGLRRQQERYRGMIAVVEEQTKLLSARDVDGLLALIERKRALMAEIEALEKDLAPVKERWAEVRAGLDEAARRELDEAVDRTREVLATLLRLEEEGRALMQQRRDATADELKALMTKKKARNAYGAPGAAPRFYDDKQ
jgi:flagellar biosynthesis/type III secretory pathway chaperone